MLFSGKTDGLQPPVIVSVEKYSRRSRLNAGSLKMVGVKRFELLTTTVSR